MQIVRTAEFLKVGIAACSVLVLSTVAFAAGERGAGASGGNNGRGSEASAGARDNSSRGQDTASNASGGRSDRGSAGAADGSQNSAGGRETASNASGGRSDAGRGNSASGRETATAARGEHGPSARGIEASRGVAGGNPPEDPSAFGRATASAASGGKSDKAKEEIAARWDAAASNPSVGAFGHYVAAIVRGDYERAAEVLEAALDGPVSPRAIEQINARFGVQMDRRAVAALVAQAQR